MSQVIESVATPIEGLHLLKPRIFHDHRGDFVKTYHEGIFSELGLSFTMREEFFSISGKKVLRGMHFQTPPEDHAKLVYCIHGAVLDVVLDLRRGSPTYGHSHSQELSADNRLVFLIPLGCAHGFLSLTSDSAMVYKTTTVHMPECDAGIRWDSFGFDWSVDDPIISERDAKFPALSDFTSPF